MSVPVTAGNAPLPFNVSAAVCPTVLICNVGVAAAAGRWAFFARFYSAGVVMSIDGIKN